MKKAALLLALVALACGESDPDPPSSPGSGGRGGQGGRGSGGAGQTASGGVVGTGGGAGGTGGLAGSPAGGAGAGGAPGSGGAGTDGPPAGDTPPAEGGADTPSPAMGNPFVYVGDDGTTAIRIYELDMQSGALMARGSATSGTSPHYLAFHPSRKYLYALSETGAGRVYAFSINQETGALTRLNDQGSGGSGPAHISMHKSGKFVLSSNYGSGHAATLPIMDDGRLGAPIMPRQAGAQAHMILDDGQSGGFVFVPSKGDNLVAQFKLDLTSGVLSANTPPSVAQGGAPRHMVFHRSGKWAFLLTEAGRSVVSYRYDATTGLLSDPLRVDAAPGGNGAHILLHPQKDFLYASIRAFNSLAVFRLDAEGRARDPAQVQTQINVPWDFDIDPTGQYMVVGNHGNSTLRVFRIDQTTGMLSIVGSGASGPTPRCVAILPR